MQFSKKSMTPFTEQEQFSNEDEFQHLSWPAQSPYLTIIEPMRPFLETRMRNGFPLPTSRKQLNRFFKKNGTKFR
jgi:hypothetical protein